MIIILKVFDVRQGPERDTERSDPQYTRSQRFVFNRRKNIENPEKSQSYVCLNLHFYLENDSAKSRKVKKSIGPLLGKYFVSRLFQCTYHLDPFDGHFDPHKHNGYYMRWFDIWIELFSAHSLSRRTALLKGPKRTKYLRVHAEFNSQTPQVFLKLFPKGFPSKPLKLKVYMSGIKHYIYILPLRQTRR